MRHVLGVSVSLSEAEVHWRAFLEGLVSRGLHGLECITSDAHSGLKAALRAVFPSAASCERLVTAILIEISEEWESGKKYLSMDE